MYFYINKSEKHLFNLKGLFPQGADWLGQPFCVVKSALNNVNIITEF